MRSMTILVLLTAIGALLYRLIEAQQGARRWDEQDLFYDEMERWSQEREETSIRQRIAETGWSRAEVLTERQMEYLDLQEWRYERYGEGHRE